MFFYFEDISFFIHGFAETLVQPAIAFKNRHRVSLYLLRSPHSNLSVLNYPKLKGYPNYSFLLTLACDNLARLCQ